MKFLEKYIDNKLFLAENIINVSNNSCEIFNFKYDFYKNEYKNIKKKFNNVGMHLPLLYPKWYSEFTPITSFLFNNNEKLYKLFKRLIVLNSQLAVRLGIEYIVFHIFSKEDNLSKNKISKRLLDFSNFLNKLSNKYNIYYYIEYIGYLGHFYKPEQYIEFIKDCKNTGICIDFGHMYLTCKKRNLNYYDTLEKLAPYAKPIHVWMAKDEETYFKYSHIPVHPVFNNYKGFYNIEKSIKLLSSVKKDYYFIHEVNNSYKLNNNGIFYKFGKKWFENLKNSIF